MPDSEQTFAVTFWGVRGGYPKPGPTTVEFGGNTTCMEIRVAGRLIIIDAGTGIVGLGEKLFAQHRADKKPIVATILFTHTHHDHTQGFPFFRPSHLGSSILYIFGPKLLHQDLEVVLDRAMLPPVFPVRLEDLKSMRIIRNISENEMLVLGDSNEPQVCNAYRDNLACSPWEVRVRIMRSYAHPQGGVFIYSIEAGNRRVVIATDVEGYAGGDRRLIRFAQGADLLVHDAEYTTEEYLGTPARQGWGHSTWEMAVKVAQAAGVGQLALTHHSVYHDDAFMADMERQAQARFLPTVVAREGMTLDVKRGAR